MAGWFDDDLPLYTQESEDMLFASNATIDNRAARLDVSFKNILSGQCKMYREGDKLHVETRFVQGRQNVLTIGKCERQ
jgi:hypothetical protein